MRSPCNLALMLVLLSATLYALSFPPVAAWPLAWVALAPLYAATARVGPARAFGLGVVWTGATAIGVASFVPGTLAAFFDVPTVLGWVAFAGVLAPIAPLYGSYCAWLARLAQRREATPLHAAAGWGACELLRTSFGPPGGWALLATSQLPGGRLIQSADLGGVYLPGMLLAAVGFAVACGLEPRLRGAGRRTAWAVAAALAAALAYGELRLAQSFGSGESFRVALVQGAEGDARGRAEHRDANLARYLALTRAAAARQPDLVVWPEYAVDFYLREASPHRERLLTALRESRTDLLLGGPHYRPRPSPPRYYNSVFLIREGRFGGRYDKLRPLPFAESNPLQAWLPREVHYSAGERAQPLPARAAPVGAFLCSEAMDPALVRRLARNGARVLANPSNDDWLGGPGPARLELHTAAVRAVENRRPLLRTTPSGWSAIVDPQGRVTQLGDFGRAEVLVGSVRPSDTVTLYQRAGDVPCALLAATTLAATFVPPAWRGRLQRRRTRCVEAS